MSMLYMEILKDWASGLRIPVWAGSLEEWRWRNVI